MDAKGIHYIEDDLATLDQWLHDELISALVMILVFTVIP